MPSECQLLYWMPHFSLRRKPRLKKSSNLSEVIKLVNGLLGLQTQGCPMACLAEFLNRRFVLHQLPFVLNSLILVYPTYPHQCSGLSWSWNSNTLATWCERADSFEKTLILGKIEGRRRRGRQRMRRLGGITDSDMGLGELWELVMD